MKDTKDIAIVVPVYDEEKSLKKLFWEICRVLNQLNRSYEIIFVEGGSKDSSFNVLTEIQQKNKSIVQVIKLNEKYGQSIAISNGMHCSQADVVITMDADLQNDPKDIPLFLEALKSDVDIVCGWRKKRQDPFFTKVFISRAGNLALSILTGVWIHDSSCTFKAFKKPAAKAIAAQLKPGYHRFIPLIAHRSGFKACEIIIHHHPRLYGKSKYNILKMFEAIKDFCIIEQKHKLTRANP